VRPTGRPDYPHSSRCDTRGRWRAGEISGPGGSGGPPPSRSLESVTIKSYPDNSYALIRNTSTTSTRSTSRLGIRRQHTHQWPALTRKLACPLRRQCRAGFAVGTELSNCWRAPRTIEQHGAPISQLAEIEPTVAHNRKWPACCFCPCRPPFSPSQPRLASGSSEPVWPRRLSGWKQRIGGGLQSVCPEPIR
jgi:hypothetical protein